MGFADAAQAERLVSEDLALDPTAPTPTCSTALAAAADPDLALAALARMPRERGPARRAAQPTPGCAPGCTAVLGASAALGDHLARHPDDWRLLRGAGRAAQPVGGRAARRTC